MPAYIDENGSPVQSVRIAGGAGAAGDIELAVAAQVAGAANNQTLAAAAGKTTYISGFFVDGLGATGASVIEVSITGLLGGTQFYEVSVPAGAGAVLVNPIRVEFARPIPASAPNTAIVVNVPSYGAGNTKASAGAHGFQRGS